ncbi:hypothetical protein D3C81_2118300 [compost metagenome]
MGGDQRLHRAHVGIVTADKGAGLRALNPGLEPLERRPHPAAIGLDQAAGAQQYATVVTHHHGRDLADT